MNPKLVIVDYGIGNVRSIISAFEKVGIKPFLSRNKAEILDADGLVLPGVGAFSKGMENLKKYDLIDVIKAFASTNKPLLGICLGMQMLLEESYEFGITKGLGLVKGKVIKLPTKDSKDEKLPHVSWNEIEKYCNKWEDTILHGISSKSDMYFVHTFVAEPLDKNNILSKTTYSDYNFCSSLKKDNIYGCQFHPEKSGEKGLKIIENFVKLIS